MCISQTSGTALPSVISSLLDEAEESSVTDFSYEDNVKAVGGNTYAGEGQPFEIKQ